VASETEVLDYEVEAEEEHEHLPFLHHHFDDISQQRESTTLCMWLFLATEAMMFGGLFFAYSLYRWMYGAAYVVGSKHLNILLGSINTLVLLVSSLTMAMAVYNAATQSAVPDPNVVRRKRRLLVSLLWSTWILGAMFIGIKGVEWTTDYREGLVPAVRWNFYDNPQHVEEDHLAESGVHPDQVKMYFVLYFSMTGLHAIHMIVGLILVGVFIRLSARGQFANGNDQPVEIMGLYWHFVDIIWVFLSRSYT